ncbi:hypothetical protein G5I_00571 [Acromyrmex echinatior]|uniref:Uncharacterized protein n=1 Tax=Acromyrmex echinatior TaxID=103372 RepID=F4W579_ACREC|nr:hypothetical protein G5I_00571 [Acromyrmex echinatior]
MTCTVSAYSDPYENWGNVIILGNLKITLQDYIADVRINTNRVHLKLKVTCELSSTYCTDMEGGDTFWDSYLSLQSFQLWRSIEDREQRLPEFARGTNPKDDTKGAHAAPSSRSRRYRRIRGHSRKPRMATRNYNRRQQKRNSCDLSTGAVTWNADYSSSARFLKDGSGYCEWFIVTADFGVFREFRYLTETPVRYVTEETLGLLKHLDKNLRPLPRRNPK